MATGTLWVGAFHPLTSTTGGVAAPDAAKCAVRVIDSPDHSVTSLSLHRIGSTSSPPADRLIDTCWNSAIAPEDGGTVSVTVAMPSAPSCRSVARTSLVAAGKDCNEVRSAYRTSGVRYQFECGKSSSSVCVASQYTLRLIGLPSAEASSSSMK